ncbi:MAG: hypothetical protein ABIR84_10405 [Candidatus Nitrotoga sp.]
MISSIYLMDDSKGAVTCHATSNLGYWQKAGATNYCLHVGIEGSSSADEGTEWGNAQYRFV